MTDFPARPDSESDEGFKRERRGGAGMQGEAGNNQGDKTMNLSVGSSKQWRYGVLTRCVSRKRGFNWGRFLAFLVLAVMIGWMLSGCSMTTLPSEIVSPWISGAMLGLLAFGLIAVLFMGSRAICQRVPRAPLFGESVWPDAEDDEETRRLGDAQAVKLSAVKAAERELFAARVRAASVARSVRATLKQSEDLKAEPFWQREWLRRGIERLDTAAIELNAATERYQMTVWGVRSEVQVHSERRAA